MRSLTPARIPEARQGSRDRAEIALAGLCLKMLRIDIALYNEGRARRAHPRGRTIAVDASEKFVAEGSVELGPKEDFFVFLDGEHLGTLLRKHFGVGAEVGYTPLGQLRVTVERADGPADGSAAPGGSSASEA